MRLFRGHPYARCHFQGVGLLFGEAVDFSFDGANAADVIANMRRFREDVLAKV